jgi:hypothetical protein
VIPREGVERNTEQPPVVGPNPDVVIPREGVERLPPEIVELLDRLIGDPERGS